ncbi:hypothetical protein FKM82_017667 [Ascaphus truei]
MKREEEKRRWAEEERVAILRQQMEELKLGELEAKKLKKEQEDLLRQQWEVEELEEDRKKMEDRRKKTELGHFLSRQYNAQMKRRAQLVQAELEMDMRILTELVSKEGDDQRLRSARREQAAADAAWMKRVIEEQLHVERQREAELDTLFREEAKQVWAKREAEWERERNARDRLMKEISERRLQEKEAMLRLEVEDREERLAEEQQNDLLQQEAEIMTHRGYQKKVGGLTFLFNPFQQGLQRPVCPSRSEELYSRPRTAWS